MQNQNNTAELVKPTREQSIIILKETAEDLQISITDDAEAKLADMQEKYPESAIPSDLSDKKNLKMVHETIQKIKAPRLALEKNRKKVVEPLNSITKKINAAAKPLKESYIELEEPWKNTKKNYEMAEEIKKREAAQAELDRVNKINSKIAEVKAIPGSHIKSDSAEIGVAITKLELDNEGFDYQEFSEQGLAGFTEALELLNEMYNQKTKSEEVERELEERNAKEKADQEKREEEERLRLAAQKKEQEEMAAKLKAQQDEIDRQQKEAAAELKAQQDEAAAKMKAQQDEIDRQQEEIEKQKREAEEAAEEVIRKEKAAAHEKLLAAEAAEEEKKREAIRAENAKLEKKRQENIKKEAERKAAEAEEAAKLKREHNITQAMEDLFAFTHGSEDDHKETIKAVISRKIRHIIWVDNLEPKIDG